MNLPTVLSFDLSDWTQIELAGAGARQYLHNFCTNDIKKLAAGSSCEAFVCDIKGRILAHLLVCGEDQRFWLISAPGQGAVVLPHLRKYLLDADVSINDRSADFGLLCLYGEGLSEALPKLFDTAVVFETGKVTSTFCESRQFLVVSTDMLGGPAVLVSGLRGDLADWRERIPDEVVAIGEQNLFETLRIQAGFPKGGVDIGPENIAQEAARTAKAISFTKGCYLGQEPIARLDAMGHTNKELRLFRINSMDAKPGQAIVVDGQTVGTLTSVAVAFEADQQLALGIMRVRHAAPGTEVQIRTESGDVPAVVSTPVDSDSAQS